MSFKSPYLEQCQSTLPRLLSLFDANPASALRGVGDRRWWGWKLTDFGNATYQGAAHGLARLLGAGLLPEAMSEASVLKRIDLMFEGVRPLQDADGSLSEAFPHEHSFAVSGLVAYDLCTAVSLLGSKIDGRTKSRYLGIIEPVMEFLMRNEETHGVISNHLATSAAAMFRWASLAGGRGEDRGRTLLKRILDGQSGEGWFREYEGADPGYQTLATVYLADIHRMRPDLRLTEPLRRSLSFLWHFAHPDGSFGGLYGSRNTRLYHPAGIEALAAEIPEAAALAAFMRWSVAKRTTVTLVTMDEPNLVPMFNSYAWAADLARDTECLSLSNEAVLPCLSEMPAVEHFPDAGLLVERWPTHYTVISTHKGGVCCHYPRNGDPAVINAGVLARAPDGALYSSQSHRRHNSIEVVQGAVTIQAPLTRVKDRLPGPFGFMVLRLLSLTLFRFRPLAEWFKRRLVALLVTGGRAAPVVNRRTIHFGNPPRIEDVWLDGDGGFTRLDGEGGFSSIHMASQGYWQKQDDFS